MFETEEHFYYLVIVVLNCSILGLERQKREGELLLAFIFRLCSRAMAERKQNICFFEFIYWNAHFYPLHPIRCFFHVIHMTSKVATWNSKLPVCKGAWYDVVLYANRHFYLHAASLFHRLFKATTPEKYIKVVSIKTRHNHIWKSAPLNDFTADVLANKFAVSLADQIKRAIEDAIRYQYLTELLERVLGHVRLATEMLIHASDNKPVERIVVGISVYLQVDQSVALDIGTHYILY